MWDKLAECTASTIDQFFTWKQTFFGPNTTSPPPPLPPCNVVRKETLADESSNIASGGKGGASEYCSNSGKRHFVPHILARIVDLKSENPSCIGSFLHDTVLMMAWRRGSVGDLWRTLRANCISLRIQNDKMVWNKVAFHACVANTRIVEKSIQRPHSYDKSNHLIIADQADFTLQRLAQTGTFPTKPGERNQFGQGKHDGTDRG